MNLAKDLIAQFVAINTPPEEPPSETILYGVVRSNQNGNVTVQLDGSEIATPAVTSMDVTTGERVMVMIKDHSMIVTGNMESPGARKADVDLVKADVIKVNELLATKIGVDELNATNAAIEELEAGKASVADLNAAKARITDLETNSITTDDLSAIDARIETLEAGAISVTQLNATNARVAALETNALTASSAVITELQASMADVDDLKANALTADSAVITELQANAGKIDTLEATALTTSSAVIISLQASAADVDDLKANALTADSAVIASLQNGKADIDFANIGEAAVRKIYASTGIINDLVYSNGSVTGQLNGVTINGDLINANTLKADRLLLKGEDGLYHKIHVLNQDSEAEETEEELAPYLEGLDGTALVARSVTAEKIAVDDLVAFNATIGGFELTEESISSVGKYSIDDAAPGIFMTSDGQLSVGDDDNYIKFYKYSDGDDSEVSPLDDDPDQESTDENIKYRLEISASSVRMKTAGNAPPLTLDEAISQSNDRIDQLETGLSSLGDVTSKIDAVEKETGRINSSLTELEAAYETTSSNINTYFEFASDGLKITSERSNSSMALDEDSVDISVEGNTVASLGLDGLSVPNGSIICRTFQIGEYLFLASNDGHLTIM